MIITVIDSKKKYIYIYVLILITLTKMVSTYNIFSTIQILPVLKKKLIFISILFYLFCKIDLIYSTNLKNIIYGAHFEGFKCILLRVVNVNILEYFVEI